MKPALTPKQRLKILEKVFKESNSVASVCRDFNISRFTFYKWAKRYDLKLSRKQNLINLRDKKPVKRKYHGRISPNIEEEVKKIAVETPSLSKYKIADKAKDLLGDKAPGVHGVYNVLKRAGIETAEKRLNWQQFVYKAKRRILTPEQRLEIIKKATELNIPVARVCRDFGISRQTFYKWKRRWEKVGNIDALRDIKPQFDRRHLRIKPNLEKAILTIVIEAPNLSKYGIARKIAEKVGTVVSPHGVYNVLLRNGLNIPEKRLAYSISHTPQVAAPVGWADRIRYVLEQFVPTTAPAPPPPLSTILNFVKTFSITSIISSATVYSIVWWIDYLASQVTTQAIGLVFATIALFMGSLFFIYSLKYYLTLALVLSFSQADSNQPAGGRGKKGIFSWLLGSDNPTSHEASRGKAVGLTPNLEHVKLKRKPYISIQVPLFNEKRVVERILKAATSFEYPEYEVILCDDSTDETSDIIRKYQKEHLAKGQKLVTQSGQGWILTSVEVQPGVTVKHLHRTSRSGFKGGALKLALTLVDPRTEFISVFDADFVPYPDTLELFLKYFQATAGTLDFRSQMPDVRKDNLGSKIKDQGSKIAAVQGYQWHVLNKSENWITRGVRSEYAGSYVIERSGEEIYSGLKQISGAVYMVRRDVLEEVGWETSITEDFQLTLKLYDAGYKVVYTPYIQAPAECVSTLKRLIRQRMRWAEGHSNNIRKMFMKLLIGKWTIVNGKKGFTKSPLSGPEKLEFLYLSPYYLQAFFFLVGTISWLISETVFPAQLPFWTSLWGWSLVLTNLLSLPLMNAVGLFLEESEERDYQGLISFVTLSYILVPFQAYASVRGLLRKEEGPWFRTPKTGHITDVFQRGRFYRFISGILPGRSTQPPAVAHITSQYLALSTANNQFDSFKVKPKRNRYIAKLALFMVVGLSSAFSYFGNRVPQGVITNLPIQARIDVTREDNSVVSQAVNLLKPKDALASSTAETIFAGTTKNEILGYVFILSVILSLAFLLYLMRRKRKLLRKIIRPLFVVALVLSWLLASWPPILLNPRFPPRIKEVHAAIAKQGTDTTGTGNGSPLTFSHTLVAGSNRMVVCSVGAEFDATGGDGDLTSATYGAQAMTEGLTAETGTTGFVAEASIFYILETNLPSDGANTFSVTATQTTVLEINAVCAQYSGVEQVAPTPTDTTLWTTGLSISNTISPPTDDWVMSAVVYGNTLSSTHGQGQNEIHDISDASSGFAAAELRGASGETSLDSTASGTINRGVRIAASWSPSVVPSAPTLYNDDGGSNQIAFNNIKENDTTPIIRASATHTSTFNRFQVEFNTASNFGGTAYTETFSGTYSSGTAYNLQTTGSLSLPSTDGVTYYLRARASANGGTDYGDWSTTLGCCGTWTYTKTTAVGDSEWFQTTDEQFDTGTLTSTQTSGSDSVRFTSGTSSQAFSTAGTDTWLVPTGITEIEVKAWGAGGGGGGGSLAFGGDGNGGGFAHATAISVTAGNTLQISVGGTGGGGTGDSTSGAGGGGGGHTGVFYPSITRTNALIIAGAGGGGGGADNDGSPINGADGGGGGPNTGEAGSNAQGTVTGGGGGTQSAGGAVGTGDDTSGTGGSALTGGKGDAHGSTYAGGAGGTNGGGAGGDGSDGSRGGGGGGGAGYYGGGGGGGSNASNIASAGGGGGSNFLSGTTQSNVGSTTQTGAGQGDGDYPGGVGDGGSGGANDNSDGSAGELGYLIIKWAGGSGTIMSTEIDFDWYDNATAWNDVDWSEDETNGTIMVQVFYSNCATIIPNGALSGNSSGFTSGPIDISGLSTSTYNEICIRATLTDSGGTPFLEDWVVTVPERLWLFLGVAPLLPGFIGKLRGRKRK